MTGYLLGAIFAVLSGIVLLVVGVINAFHWKELDFKQKTDSVIAIGAGAALLLLTVNAIPPGG